MNGATPIPVVTCGSYAFALLLLSGCGSSDALPDLESQRLDLSESLR